jgi:hypothetical protein
MKLVAPNDAIAATNVVRQDDYSDRKNASMKCPFNRTEIDHLTIMFRAKTGVNSGKLFWKCMDCADARGTKGKLIGMDSELEADGMKTIDPSRGGPNNASDASLKRQKIAEDSIVASGRGVNWSQLASDVSCIRADLSELVKLMQFVKRESDIGEKGLTGIIDLIAKHGTNPTDPGAAIGELNDLITNIAAAASTAKVSDDSTAD